MERCVRMVLALLLGVLAAGEAYGQHGYGREGIGAAVHAKLSLVAT